MQCQICTQNVSKYKCPSCLISFCSVSCWKSHKTETCEARSKDVARQKDAAEGLTVPCYKHTTQDTVSVEQLKLLESSEGLRSVLQNPHIRDVLIAINSSEDPERAIQTAMLEPKFVEFVDECLKVVEPPESPP